MTRRGRWRLVRLGRRGCERCGLADLGEVWHGVAGTEWRMQVGGERLGRVGIVRVAVGQVWSGCSGKESSGLTGSGWLRHGRHGKAS